MAKISKENLKLAKKAGFIFWGNEEYGPGKGHIDWSCEYNKELEKFAELVRKNYEKKLLSSLKK